MKCTTASAPEVVTRAEARERGLRHYFTGKLCRHGHLDKRSVLDARCAECARQFTADWITRNLERKRKTSRDWRAANPERCIANGKAYHAANLDKRRENNRRWRNSNRERRRASIAKYFTAKKLRIPPWADLELIRQFYLNCPEGYEVDHIHPLQGKLISGLHVIENLQYLTAHDNRVKYNTFEQSDRRA